MSSSTIPADDPDELVEYYCPTSPLLPSSPPLRQYDEWDEESLMRADSNGHSSEYLYRYDATIQDTGTGQLSRATQLISRILHRCASELKYMTQYAREPRLAAVSLLAMFRKMYYKILLCVFPPPIPCSLCHDLYPGFIRESKGYFSRRCQVKFTELEDNAAPPKGCNGCFLLLKAVKLASKDINKAVDEVGFTCEPWAMETLTIRMTYDDGSSSDIFEVCSTSENLSPWCAILPLAKISQSPKSVGAVEWIKSQLSTCIQEHPACCRNLAATPKTPQGGPRRLLLSDSTIFPLNLPVADHVLPRDLTTELPSRVLDLGSLDDGLDLTSVKLLVTEGKRAEYLCLSHCWGKTEPIKLTGSTLSTFQTEIPLPCLPLTFIEAMQLTRNLGFRYIWIDSLCIVQDSQEDWGRESAKMRSIYQNAALTIAATAAADSRSGCFTPRDRATVGTSISSTEYYAEYQEVERQMNIGLWKRLTRRVHDYHNGVKRSWNVHVRKGLWHPEFYGFDDELEKLPLLDRAWVYQERLLSPRIIHCTPEEYVWECSQSTLCECGTLETKDRHDLHRPKVDHTGSMLYGGHAQFVSHWHTVVMQYSRLKLTFGCDKLPAIAGMAKQFAQFRQAKYLAGLWSDSLMEDLLWYVGHPCPKAEEWQAPSWTWASVTSSINHHKDFIGNAETVPLLKYVGYTRKLKNPEDVFGALDSGNLLIEAWLTSVRVRRHTKREGCFSWAYGEDFGVGPVGSSFREHIHFDPDWLWPEPETDNPHPKPESERELAGDETNGAPQKMLNLWVDITPPREIIEVEDTEYTYRNKGIYEWDEVMFAVAVAEMGNSLFFLVLRDVGNGEFNRVGIGQQRLKHRGDSWLFDGSQPRVSVTIK